MKYLLLFILASISFQSCTVAQKASTGERKDGDTITVSNKKYFVHTVQKKETIFSLAHQFNISENDLMVANPELKDGLKKGNQVLIPLRLPVVLKDETGERKKLYENQNAEYRITFILSVNAKKNFSTDASLVDSLVPAENINEETSDALQFYQGAQVALDSMTNLGFKSKIFLFDAGDDSSSFQQMMMKPEMKTMDLIVTNLSKQFLKSVSDFSQREHIWLLSCAPNSTDIIRTNEYAISGLPSSNTQCRSMGEFAAKQFKHGNIIALKTTQAKEQERTSAFISGVQSDSSSNISLKEINYSETGWLKLKDTLSTTLHNYIFVPSSNEDFVSVFLLAINNLNERFQVSVIGLPTWQHFETIDPPAFQRSNVYIFDSQWTDYNLSNVVEFRKKFRNEFATEPNQHACLGYDALLFFSSRLFTSGKNFTAKLQEQKYVGLSASFQFKKLNGTSCFENTDISILKYGDFELLKTDK